MYWLLCCLFVLVAQAVQAQTLNRTHLGLVNPLEYGASCNDTTLSATISAVAGAQRTVMLTATDRAQAACTWAITANVTVPDNIVLWIPQGAAVSVDSGRTLTLATRPLAEHPAWYSGAGTVVITTPAYPGSASLPYVHSGCLPATSGSTTLAAFACTALVPTPSGDAEFVVQTSASVGPLSGGNGTYWLALHWDTTTSVSGWTRQSGTRYLWQLSAARPADPTHGLIIAQVTVASSAASATALAGSTDPTGENIINVERWGARPTHSGATNATAIQNALNHAAAVNGRLVFPRLYPITTVRVPNGVREITGPGGLQATGQYGTYGAVLELAGTQFAGTVTPNTLRITSMTFVMATAGTGAKHAIYGDCSSCVISNNTFTGYTDINGHAGITLFAESAYTRIQGNLIFLVQPPLTANHTAVGIQLIGTVDTYGNYFAGAGTCNAASAPVHHLTITGNVIFGGSHGVFGRGVTHVVISGNAIHYSWHRGTELEFSSSFNTVSGNTYTEWYSSAVNMSYCSSYNTVSSNTAHSTVSNGQAAFLAYVGTSHNLIEHNKIQTGGTAALYGVYLAVNSSQNTVQGNDITGHRLAAIAIDSDWKDPQPGSALYSLPVGLPAAGQWAYSTCNGNIIQNNVIRAPTGTSAAGISVAAIGTVGGVINTIVRGNHVESTAHDHQWYLFEENSSDPATGIWLKNNTWNAGFFYTGPRGLAHYADVADNYALDGPGFYGFGDGDTTPDVSVGKYFATANTGATSITNFDGGGLEGREIIIRIDVNTTLVHNNSLMRLRGATNVTGDSNFFIKLKNIGGVWYEQWRQGA